MPQVLPLLYLLYIIITLYYFVISSRKGSLYVFSPIITIYLAFALSNIYPLFVYERDIPKSITNVTAITCCINLFFLIEYKDAWRKKLVFTLEPVDKPVKNKRNDIFVIFWLLIIVSGILTGVPSALLHGIDVEDLRRTSEIGLGFIRNIPAFGVPLLLLINCLSEKYSTRHVAIICLFYGLVFFLTTAARADLQCFIIIFFIWFNIKKRSFKWYEYLAIFYLFKPIVATFLLIVRSGQTLAITEFTLFEHEKMIFGSNTIRLAEWIEDSNLYLYGYSYFYNLVSIIPRFIWPGKPLAVDYYYKEVVGFEFDGGGIYTTPDFDLFLNFGYFYIIPYALWLYIIHLMYGKILEGKPKLITATFYMLTLASAFAPGTLISRFELFYILLIIFFIANRKWKVV